MVAVVTVEGFERTEETARFQVRVRLVRARMGSLTQTVAVPSVCSVTSTEQGASATRGPTVPPNQKLTAVSPSEGTDTPCWSSLLASTRSQPVSAARTAVRCSEAPGSS